MILSSEASIYMQARAHITQIQTHTLRQRSVCVLCDGQKESKRRRKGGAGEGEQGALKRQRGRNIGGKHKSQTEVRGDGEEERSNGNKVKL